MMWNCPYCDGLGFGMSGWLSALIVGFFALLFLIGVVLLVWWAASNASSKPSGRHGGTAPSDRALDVARERYARGEITREEYEEIRRNLSG